MPAGAPGTGMASSEDGRSPYGWFAFRLAEGVSRGESYLPHTYTLLRGWLRVLTRWGNLLRRDSPRPLSDLFAPPKHPFWRNFFGTLPSAEAGGGFRQMGKPWPLAGCWEKAQQSTRGPGDGNDFPWGWQIVVSSARARVSRRRAAWGRLSSSHLCTLARVAAGPRPPGSCPPRLYYTIMGGAGATARGGGGLS